MIEKDDFLKKAFRRYYYENINKICAPQRLPEREIGYLTFYPEKMIRHVTLKNEGELKALLVHEAPKSVYYSTAYYDDPSAPINSRLWKGADLVFDIDLDHMPFKENHMTFIYICNSCNSFFADLNNKRCSLCGSEKITTANIPTKEGLEYGKDAIIRLIDILTEDFGIGKDKIKIYFSGKRGYHLTVENSLYEDVDQNFRLELSDYLTLNGFKLLNTILNRNVPINDLHQIFPLPHEKGWMGRLSKSFFEDIIGIKLENWDETYLRSLLQKYFSTITYKDLQLSLEKVIDKIKIRIDTNVTTDIHRIFRMPETLHGETGLLKKRITNIDTFHPLVDAIAFSQEPIKVYVDYAPRFELNEQIFGPYKKEEVILPEMAAVFLICMGLAKPLEFP
ncbi:MAG: DNA primase small subunit domain-containing protein [Nitrososphaeria archaeon]